MPDFKRTIDWITSTTKYNKLPLVAIGNAKVKINAPYLIVSVRKTNNYRYPYCFALFAIANIAFIVLYTSKDKFRYTTSNKYATFQEMIQLWYKGFEWSFNKLSSSKKTYTPIDFTINIPSECKLGRDYFIVNKNK